MNRIKNGYKIAKACNLYNCIYQYILVTIAISIASIFVNPEWDLGFIIPMTFILLNFIIGSLIRNVLGIKYNLLTSIPYKSEDIIKDMFSFMEIIVLLTFTFDIIINLCFGRIDVALAHLALCFLCLMSNYLLITFTAENQMKISGTNTKMMITIFICTFVSMALAFCGIMFPIEMAGDKKLRFIYLAVAVAFALCNIIFRKKFINKTLKKIRG